MSIVLKENEWAKNMIQERSLGKKPSETLCRVARYYMDCGYSKNDARTFLDTFLIQCDPSSSLTKWSSTLDYAVDRASKSESLNIDCIYITESEIKKISALDGKQIKRLAFTLLCLSKYWYSVSAQTGHWVNNKDSEIMSLANINTSIKRQSYMYKQLREAGLIQFSKKVDNTNIRVCFTDDESPAVIEIKDFRNLGYQYMKYTGEPYFECEHCGITTKIENPGRGRRQKYCKECAIAVNMQQRVNSVMRKRYALN